MRFPRFWAQGKAGVFAVWRWSDTSVQEAKEAAQAAAERLSALFKANNLPNEKYGYGNRPMREPVVKEIRNSAGELAAAVTRNSYGCHVLNTSSALFVDVDLPEPKKSVGGLFGSLFGKPAEPEDPAKTAMAKAAAWAQAHPGWNWRIYRTRGGLRLLATHALFDPADPVCERVFAAMNADPLYRKLCQTQECFRARLTPKPWRCKIGHPPARWPFEGAGEEQAFANWDAKYQAACRAKATCQLLDRGSAQVHPELKEIVTLHDEMTRAGSVGFELA
ncbi:MAG TPA: hypothetical protein VNU44_22355 [Bryobacteraceae bacterium]|nr:hypothetical protein [Bryobacteraceae bacterium]